MTRSRTMVPAWLIFLITNNLRRSSSEIPSSNCPMAKLRKGEANCSIPAKSSTTLSPLSRGERTSSYIFCPSSSTIHLTPILSFTLISIALSPPKQLVPLVQALVTMQRNVDYRSLEPRVPVKVSVSVLINDGIPIIAVDFHLAAIGCNELLEQVEPESARNRPDTGAVSALECPLQARAGRERLGALVLSQECAYLLGNPLSEINRGENEFIHLWKVLPTREHSDLCIAVLECVCVDFPHLPCNSVC